MKTKKYYLKGILAFIFFVASCTGTDKKNKETNSNDTAVVNLPEKKAFQSTIDGKNTDLFILKNANGMTAAITNYGGRLVSLLVPSKKGKLVDVVVGYDSLKPYTEGADTYFGAIIGRYGNRIAKGKFSLDGKQYTLATNNGVNHLHGGNKGFSRVVWDAKQEGDSSLILTYFSKNGEEGYPANLKVKVTYALTNSNGLKISYEATTDQKTIVNLTNHSYFNLNGQGSGTINNHLLQINSNLYTPVDSTSIPTGKLEDVEETPFDFRKPIAFGARVNENNEQLKNGHGYDHNFVLNPSEGAGLNHAATAIADQSGIVMDVLTTEPGLQFYGGNFLKGKHTIKEGKKDGYRTAFCLETQHFPDSPNEPSFPSTVSNPGQTYKSTSIYKFSVK